MVKFLQIKQDTIREKCCQKHEKWLYKSVHTQEVWHSLPLYAAVRILLTPHLPPVAYAINQLKTYKGIRISYSLKYKHSKKLISLRKAKW